MATLHRCDEPTLTADEYWLSITDDGRAARVDQRVDQRDETVGDG